MNTTTRPFLPAAGKSWALPFYDTIARLLGSHEGHADLIEQAALHDGLRVLDVGCGTGTLIARIKLLHPAIEITGLDPDAAALARARRKVGAEATNVTWQIGYADALPYPDQRFDRVFSAFMFHHLDDAVQTRMLREAFRVLAPGGSLHLADMGGSDGTTTHGLRGKIERADRIARNHRERIVTMMRDAGFDDAAQVFWRPGPIAGIASYCAVRGGSVAARTSVRGANR